MYLLFCFVECVYGANLINLCHKEGKIVPLFVVEITKEIENKGLDMDGIYRISGNLAEVQKVRHQVDQGFYEIIIYFSMFIKSDFNYVLVVDLTLLIVVV